MFQIFKKEINQFFSSITGYIPILVFLSASALLVFILPETSIFQSGYANLDSFFDAAPYILLFLIPAITMGSFAEERAEQTLEFLFTKPISYASIILGKYLASIFILLLCLLLTTWYVHVVGQLAEPINNVDFGGIWGSYFGLFLLGTSYCAIGLLSSSLSPNQIVAFIVALFLCFLFYFVFGSISNLPWLYGKLDYYIQQLGMEYHYLSISRGVIVPNDIIYFLSVVIFSLWLTFVSLKNQFRP